MAVPLVGHFLPFKLGPRLGTRSDTLWRGKHEPNWAHTSPAVGAVGKICTQLFWGRWKLLRVTLKFTFAQACISTVYPPPLFFFFGWSGHLLGISRQLQSFWLLISTNPIIWTTQWARSIVSLEHHAVARIINPGSHFSVQVPGEKEKKGQPINYHNHVNRLGGLLHVQVSCGVGSATHGYTGWRLSTVSQIRLYVNNGNGKGWFSCCFGSEVCFSGLSLEGNFVGINPVRFSVLHF